MDIGIGATVVGTGVATLTLVYCFFRNVRADIKQDFNYLHIKLETNENRLFELALGKDFKGVLRRELNKTKQSKNKDV